MDSPADLDEKAVRDELTRQFSTCVECRRCLDLCGAFPTLFDLVDAVVDRDPGGLTPHQQDLVVDACHQCNLCAVGCPYRPEVSDLLSDVAVDVPRLMLRARAMRRAAGQVPLRQRIAVSIASAPVPRLLARSGPGSAVRRAVGAATGVSAVRMLPPRAKHLFTAWFHARTDDPPELVAGRVAVVPTCHVEHHVPEIGRDLVELYERLGIGCSLADVVCCGAPQLHSGDLEGFRKTADRNVARLADLVRDGARAIVVPQSTCAFVLAIDTPRVVGSDDADLVAAHVRDACELVEELIHDGQLEVPKSVGPARAIVHAPCRDRARHTVLPAARLLERLGLDVHVVAGCSGTADTWGLRTDHEVEAIGMAEALGVAIAAGDRSAGERVDDVVHVGGCALANVAVAERTGIRPLHPIQLVKRILTGR